MRMQGSGGGAPEEAALHLWLRAFRLRDLFIVVMAGVMMAFPIPGSPAALVTATLLLVVLPYNLLLRSRTLRVGRVPMVMAVGDPLIASAFAVVVPETLPIAMTAALMDIAIAGVALSRRAAVVGASVGAVAFAAVPLLQFVMHGSATAGWEVIVPGYALTAFVTAVTVGTLVQREQDGRRHLSELIESLGVVVYEYDRATERLRFVGGPAEAISGHSLADWRRTPALVRQLAHPDDAAQVKAAFAHAAATGDPVDVTYRVFTRSGEVRWVRNLASIVSGERGQVSRGSIIDVTDQKLAEAALAEQATTDALTGMANRAVLMQRVATALAQSGPDRLPLVLFLDLDKIKRINDSLGHAAGDRLLCAVAARLRAAVRTQDTIARLGGDEYAVLAVLEQGDAAAQVAARLQAAFREPFDVDGRSLRVTASIGAVVAEPGVDAESLLAAADAAMYDAKRRGGDSVAFFTPQMRAHAVEQLTLEVDLRRAVHAGDQMHLLYQPIVRAADARVVGVEALLRWEHPERGLVSPADFIPLAELTGDIVPLGRWVVHEACRQHARWREERPDLPLTLSVNVSARQLADPELVAHVREALYRTGTPAAMLCLELTETALVSDPVGAAAVLRELGRLGVRLALDDFGTGFSSLTHLQRFPVDTVKVDRSFVRELCSAGGGAAIVASTISMASHLGIQVVAEGVETSEQRDALVALECELLQGYLFARPLPGDRLLDWVSSVEQAPVLPRPRPAAGEGVAHVAPTLQPGASS